MWYLIERLLGWRCCGEWTQWQKRKRLYSRDPCPIAEPLAFEQGETQEYYDRWQERRCTMCGRIEQKGLDH